MYPSVGFASQAQEYVSKEQGLLTDAPFGGFSESLARRLPKICDRIYTIVSMSVSGMVFLQKIFSSRKKLRLLSSLLFF